MLQYNEHHSFYIFSEHKKHILFFSLNIIGCRVLWTQLVILKKRHQIRSEFQAET